MTDTPVRPWTETTVVGTAAAAHRRLRARQRLRRLRPRPRAARHAARRLRCAARTPTRGEEGRPAKARAHARRARDPHRRQPRREAAVLLHARRGRSAGSSTRTAGTRARRSRPSRPRPCSEAARRAARDRGRVRGAAVRRRLREGARRRGARPPRGRQPRRRAREHERGDVAKGFAEADAVVELTFRTPCEIHTPMETHGSVAKWDGDRLTVRDTNQGVFDLRSAYAQYFQLPLGNVRVVSTYMGGGFGSKLEPGKYTVIAGAARAADRPAGQALPLPRGDLPLRRQPPAQHAEAEGRGEEGRHAHRAAARRRRHGRRLSRGLGRRLPGERPLPVPERADRGDQRLRQRRQGARLPRARVPAGRLGARAGDGRAGAEARHGPGGAAAQERAEGQPAPRRPAVHQHRPRAVPAGRGEGLRLGRGAPKAARRGPRRARRRRRRRHVGLGRRPARHRRRCATSPTAARASTTGASDIGTGTKTWMAMVVAEELGVPVEQHPRRPRRHRHDAVRRRSPAAARRCTSTRPRCARRRST